MSLLVEDGTGVPNAEAYCSVETADKYFADRGVFNWATLTPEEKERGLRLGADYIELRYARRFAGFRALSYQTLSFPRYHLGPIVPQALQRANAEYALRALQGPLIADPVTDATGTMIKSTKEKLGPIEESVEYATTARELFKPYPAADNLLKSLLRSSGTLIR